MTALSISTILIIINIIVSYKGFKDPVFFDKYKFTVDSILIQKDYKRLITSGFLHGNWMHLIFNMLSLYFFASYVEIFGSITFLLIYFAGLVGGDLFSLFIHRQHGDYSSIGASGAICAVVFSSIALVPGMQIGFFLLPTLPGWLYGLVYVIISIYGIKSQTDNIGHDAHLGGGLAGMLVAVILNPSVIVENTFALLIVALPAIAFILFIIYKPEALLVDNIFFKKHHHLTVEDKYNLGRISKQKELDRLLEKIHQKGIKSLSQKERENLKEYSK